MSAFSDGYQMEQMLRQLDYTRSNSVVDAAALDGNTLHARKIAKKMVVRKLRTKRLQAMLLKNDQAGKLFGDALKLDPENDKEFYEFVTLLKQGLDSLGLKSPTLKIEAENRAEHRCLIRLPKTLFSLFHFDRLQAGLSARVAEARSKEINPPWW